MSYSNLEDFARDMRTYFEVATKWHTNAYLCSLRGKLRLEKEEFDRLAVKAHQAGLITLARADLVQAMDPQYLAASEIEVGSYRFHFMTDEAPI
jgi:hypothetical protein